MATRIKTIFVTCDEDLVRQVSLRKSQNTHIIDLDSGEQITSTDTSENNTRNSALVVDSSRLYSETDQVHKRALNVSYSQQLKAVKVSRKSSNLACLICGDRAIGYNYDVLSCASCKAVFHRYAHLDPKNFKCLTGSHQCSVDFRISRKCIRCRLERCLAMGMRKDWILTREQMKQRKNRPNSQSQSLPTVGSTSNSGSILLALDNSNHFLLDMNSNEIESMLSSPLTMEDLSTIQIVQSSFLSFFEKQNTTFTDFVDLTDHASALISWSQFFDAIALSLIKCFRQLDQFENLDAENRCTLVKYNLLVLSAIAVSFECKQLQNHGPYSDYERAEKKRQFYVLCDGSNVFRHVLIPAINFIIQITEYDEVFLSLLLIIFLFSPNLSIRDDQPLLHDSLSVYRAQSFYTKVLWNYLLNKHGEPKTYRVFTQILALIFQLQSASAMYEDFMRNQLTISDTVDKITPLIQTLLHIS